MPSNHDAPSNVIFDGNGKPTGSTGETRAMTGFCDWRPSRPTGPGRAQKPVEGEPRPACSSPGLGSPAVASIPPLLHADAVSGSSIFFAAVVTGIVGLFASGIVGTALNDWFHFYANREMNGGLLAIFLSAIGGIVFFIYGYVVSSIVAGQPGAGFTRAAGISCGSVVALSAAVLMVGRWRADLPPKIGGEELALAIELRSPAGFVPPRRADESTTGLNVLPANHRVLLFGPLNLYRVRQVDGQWIIAAKVYLGTSAAKKVLVVKLGPDHTLTFALPLRAHPNRSDMEWSAWLEPDAAPAGPALGRGFSMRYRVRTWKRTNEDVEIEAAQEAEREQARFDALDASTPIEAWLNHTIPGTPEARHATAVKHIVSRPEYVAELAAVMVGASDEFAVMALEVVARLPPPRPALLRPVAAAGRDIARRIREVNAGAVGDDPHPSGGQSASLRFTAWMVAVRALRETSGGDFTPELGEILALSRVRPKTVLLQENVRSVASQAMKDWANLEPQPGDLRAP